jgi:hypothetical protein
VSEEKWQFQNEWAAKTKTDGMGQIRAINLLRPPFLLLLFLFVRIHLLSPFGPFGPFNFSAVSPVVMSSFPSIFVLGFG